MGVKHNFLRMQKNEFCGYMGKHVPSTYSCKIMQRETGGKYLFVNQERLLRDVSVSEGVSVSTVRNIFKSAEKIVFDYLSSTTSENPVSIKIAEGFLVEGKYHPETKIKNYDGESIVEEKIWVKPKVTRNYNRKINSSYSKLKNNKKKAGLN